MLWHLLAQCAHASIVTLQSKCTCNLHSRITSESRGIHLLVQCNMAQHGSCAMTIIPNQGWKRHMDSKSDYPSECILCTCSGYWNQHFTLTCDIIMSYTQIIAGQMIILLIYCGHSASTGATHGLHGQLCVCMRVCVWHWTFTTGWISWIHFL